MIGAIRRWLLATGEPFEPTPDRDVDVIAPADPYDAGDAFRDRPPVDDLEDLDSEDELDEHDHRPPGPRRRALG